MGITACILRATALALLLADGASGGDESACVAPASGAEDTLLAVGDRLVAGSGAEIVLAGIALVSPGGDEWTALARHISGTDRFRIATTGPADRYGRTHALAFGADGTLLQERLVRAGVALVRPGRVEAACIRRLYAAEAAARDAGAGLWRDPGIVAKARDATSLSARRGLYAVVEGRIVSVGHGSRMVFLDFGRSVRTDFTVLVQQSLVARLLDAGIPVDSLVGRIVRVRGVIEESGGPAIRLADPLALEILDRTE